MSDTLSAVAGGAMIIGLFVAYARERRARTRARQVGASPPVDPVVSAERIPVAAPDTSTEAAALEPSTGGRSPNWGLPIVYGLLLIAVATHRGSVWGTVWQVVYLAIVALGAYSTFAPSELAGEQRRHPGTTRASHYVTFGVPYVLLPLVGWILVGPMRLPIGILAPIAPWIGLAVIGLAFWLWTSIRGPGGR